MSTNTTRPSPSQPKDKPSETRRYRSATHDYWPRDFWDVAPDTGAESRPSIGDWASI